MNRNLNNQQFGESLRPLSEVRGYEFGDAHDWDSLHQSHGRRAEQLAPSVAEHGVQENLWVDDTRNPPLLHDGHARLLAAHQTGQSHVPVRSYSLDEMEEDFYH